MKGKEKLLCAVILSSYIGLVWSCRNENADYGTMKLKLITRIKYNINSILLCPGITDEIRRLFTELDRTC